MSTHHYRIIEKELTSGNHISSHLYQISREKKYVIFSKQNSKYNVWEKFLNENFPFDLSNYHLRALTPPSPGGVKEPVLSLVQRNILPYDSTHLKLLGVNNKHNFAIDTGVCKKLFDVGKFSLTRCCLTYKSFLITNHFMIDKLQKFINQISKYCDNINIPSGVCFDIDEHGDIANDIIHIQYPCESNLIIKNLASDNSTLKNFLVNECGVVQEKIDKYDFKKYFKNYKKGELSYIKINLNFDDEMVVKYYRQV